MSDSDHGNVFSGADGKNHKLQLPGGKDYAIAYHEVLNPAQFEAVQFGQGPLLVIAGAGSGKTRTLTYRVARLVEDGVDAKSILLLSFTRKASAEMLKRASELLDHRCEQVVGGTFHSFAFGVLQRWAPKIGFGHGFTVIDRSDAEDLIALSRKEVVGSTRGQQLPRKATLATIFSRAVNKETDLEDIIFTDYGHFGYQLEVISDIWRNYNFQKRSHQLCDFDDLLVLLRKLLREDETVRNHLTSQFQYILVDEFQDTNSVQGDIVWLLSGPQRNVMVVGDDAQSIYAFRGANFKNIMVFPEQFPGTTIIKLEENYRSRQPILDLTNALIEPAAEKYSKRLFSCREGGEVPRLVAAANENAQSSFVVNEIMTAVSRGVPLSQIAVLFRAGFHAFDLELELNHHGLGFVKYGGFKFTESAHIKDVLAHLKVMASPQDRISWYRVLLMLENIGPKAAQHIFEAISKQNAGATGLLDLPLTPKQKSAVEGLKGLVGALQDPFLSVAEMGEAVLSYYHPYLEERFDDHPKRLRDLHQLISIMDRYEKLDVFLADMTLEPPSTSMDNQLVTTDDQRSCLTLSTIHSAKGLEWDIVFVIWALDGRFPSIHSLDNPENLEEERRLMYVAATRAREMLYFTYPTDVYDRTTQSVLYEPSRFLEDIPEHLLKRDFYNPYY